MMKKYQIYLPRRYGEKIEKLVEDGYFPNESEVFRDFTRKYLNDYLEDIREEVGAAGVRKE